MLWEIFISSREEVAGSWRNLRNDKNVYSSPNIIKDEIDRECSMCGKYEKFITKY
jgi:hypothetical protein